MTKSLLIITGTGMLTALVLWSSFQAQEPATDTRSPVLEKPARTDVGKRSPNVIQINPKEPLSTEEQSAALDQGVLISGLFEAAADGAPDKIESVYSALHHRNQEVREAAVEVIVQMVGREGIPRLRTAMAAASSLEEKKTIFDAIEFLELPTLAEVQGQGVTFKSKREVPAKRLSRKPQFRMSSGQTDSGSGQGISPDSSPNR